MLKIIINKIIINIKYKINNNFFVDFIPFVFVLTHARAY